MADTLDPPRQRRLNENDWKAVAEYVFDELRRRAKHPRRVDLAKQWKEIDRQVAMDPIRRLDARTGKPIAGTEWMPELEESLQAQALETLMADANRLMFAEDRNWFSAHVAMDDEYGARLRESGLVFGTDGPTPFLDDQEGVDALLEGALMHFHGLYDFRGMVDRINAEAFKYGTWAARVRHATLDKFTTDFRGRAVRRQRVPVLMPQPIKNTYLDDTCTAVLHEGLMVAPSFIYEWWHRLDDLKLAASKGSGDPGSESGGWMPDALAGVEPIAKDNKSIQCAELEGDLIVPRGEGPGIFLPNVIVSVVFGKGGPRVFRFREREFDFRSYLCGAYHQEDVESPYGSSPLMKGMPLQAAASEALNRLMQSAILNTEPPVTWNPNDPYMQKMGGPVIEPGAKWNALTKPEIVEVGSPDALLQAYLLLVRRYEEVTGVNAVRLGAQTKSHQTAYAVDTEQDRGQIRTVKYVRSQMFGPFNSLLHMEHDMLRQSMKRQPVYIPKLDGWAEIGKEQIPERATFDVHGSAGPAEEREKEAKELQALMGAAQFEPIKAQLAQAGIDTGKPLKLEEVQKYLLTKGGIDNAEQFFGEAAAGPAGAAGGAAGGSPLEALAAVGAGAIPEAA